MVDVPANHVADYQKGKPSIGDDTLDRLDPYRFFGASVSSGGDHIPIE